MPLENTHLNTQVVSPYQLFLLYIRSPKTIEEYTNKFNKFDKFFNFLINTLGETDFKTDDTETKYFIYITTIIHFIYNYKFIIIPF